MNYVYVNTNDRADFTVPYVKINMDGLTTMQNPAYRYSRLTDELFYKLFVKKKHLKSLFTTLLTVSTQTKNDTLITGRRGGGGGGGGSPTKDKIIKICPNCVSVERRGLM